MIEYIGQFRLIIIRSDRILAPVWDTGQETGSRILTKVCADFTLGLRSKSKNKFLIFKHFSVIIWLILQVRTQEMPNKALLTLTQKLLVCECNIQSKNSVKF